MRYCGHCGKQIKNETRFCPFCGRSVIDDLSVNDAAQNLSKEPLKKIKKTVAVIIIAVTLVVVIAAVCIAYFLKHENKKIDVQTFSDLSAQSESDTVSDEILDASDSPSPEVLYKDVLDFYYYGIASNWENVEKLQNNEYEVSDRLIDFCPDSSFIKQIGYMFADINDDGMDELFITADVDGVGGFCDLYTYMNGKAIHLLSCDGLSVYFLCEDNTLYVYSEIVLILQFLNNLILNGMIKTNVTVSVLQMDGLMRRGIVILRIIWTLFPRKAQWILFQMNGRIILKWI